MIKRLSISGLLCGFLVSFGFSVFYSSALFADPSDPSGTSLEEQPQQKAEELPVVVPALMTDNRAIVVEGKTTSETMATAEELPIVVPAQMKEQEARQEPKTETEEKPVVQQSNKTDQDTVAKSTEKDAQQDTPKDLMASKRHFALTLTDTPKYTKTSTHYDYVNPSAPKGGEMRLPVMGSFDSLNPFTIKGSPAGGILLTYDSLMEQSLDEGSTQYCHLCEWVSYPSDYSSVTFKLRQGPTFHDGKPITAEDVMFSMTELKKANPRYGQYYKNVTRSAVTGPNEVTFYFDVKNNRELPFIVGELNVLPKHYWTGENKKGETRSLRKTTLEIPLSSGPYKVSKVRPGRSLVLERVPDYWGKDSFTAKGKYNFDQVKFEYFRDSSVAFEAFKADAFDFYNENSSVNWARNYEFKALKTGLVIKNSDYVLKNPQGMQGFVFNLRRDKFTDVRVREAISRAFNFEWASKNLFYNQYKRTTSYFENSILASSGKPSPEELTFLEPLKADLPAKALTDEYKPFVHDGNKGTRKQLREARKLLEQAGWTIRSETVNDKNCGFVCSWMIKLGLQSAKKTNILRNKAGEPLEIEFLIISPAFQRVLAGYVANLNQLGIKTSMRLVDSPQYQKRLETFDYDMIISTFGQSESPGNEQRFYWGSASADKNGSRNYIGIKNKAIDTLIDKIIFAKNRDELITVTKALDRVLLFNHYVVPNWHSASERIAYWNRFSAPNTKPTRSIGYLQTWWYDEAKAKLVKAGGKKSAELK